MKPATEADYYRPFRAKLEDLINTESMEGGSDTPDFVLAG